MCALFNRKKQGGKKDNDVFKEKDDVLSALLTGDGEKQTDMSKVVDKFINAENDERVLERLSELNQSQIMGVTVLLTTAKKYKLSFLDELLHHYLSLMFSKNRKSRQEIIELFKSYNPYEMDPERLEMIKNLRR